MILKIMRAISGTLRAVYLPPSEKGIRRKICAKFLDGRQKVMDCLRTAGSRTTLDYWTSPNAIPFLVVTAHFFNDTRTILHECLLDFREVPHPHTGMQCVHISVAS